MALRSLDCFGDPYIGAYLIHNMKYGVTPKRIIIAAINQARKRAQTMRRKLDKQVNLESLVGTVILYRFITDSFYSQRRYVCNYVFWNRERKLLKDKSNTPYLPRNMFCNNERNCFVCFHLSFALCILYPRSKKC